MHLYVLLGVFGQTVYSIITISHIFPSSQELFLMYTTTWNGGKVYLVPSCSVHNSSEERKIILKS